MLSSKKESCLTLCKKIAFCLLCAILFDACVFGGGEILHYGGLGFRQALLLLLCLFCIPILFASLKKLFRIPYVWMLLAFLAWIVFQAVRGFLNSNLLLATDITTYVYLAFVPLALLLIDTKEKAEVLMRTMIYGTLVLSVMAIVLLLFYLNFNHLVIAASFWGYENSLFRLGSVSTRIPRIFLVSGPYLIAGCVFSIYFAAKEKGKKIRILYCLTPALCLFAALLSFTRSMYLGFFAAFLVLIPLALWTAEKTERKKILTCVISFVLLFSVITTAFSLGARTNYVGYGLERLGVSFPSFQKGDSSGDKDSSSDKKDPFSDESFLDEKQLEELLEQQAISHYNQITISSDNLRSATIKETVQAIVARPLLGFGLGHTIPSRPDGNEYSYLDIWMKTGIVGLVLFLLPLLFFLIDLVKEKKKNGEMLLLKTAWLAFLVGMMAYSFFNPYILSALGFFVYGCTIAVFQNMKS